MKNSAIKIFASLFLGLSTISCDIATLVPEEPEQYDIERTMILCSYGFNNLYWDLQRDIRIITKQGTYIPEKDSDRALIIISQFLEAMDYSNITPINIERVWKENGKVVKKTVKTIDRKVLMIDDGILNECLEVVQNEVHSKNYGIFFASHGTGWVPEGYYERSFVKSSPISTSPLFDFNPRFKAYGSSARKIDGTIQSYEIDFRKVRANIPMRLEYIVFDACLMGCAEVVCEFKDMCDKMLVSPTEILASGFECTSLCEKLLKYDSPKLEEVAKDLYNKYGPYESVTVSVVDCHAFNKLVDICAELISKYRNNLKTVDADSIQRFFRPYPDNPHSWYYDLEDIFIKAGASKPDLEALSSVLSEVITYKIASKQFELPVYGFKINHFCGLSMYLPKMGDSELDAYYKGLKWNIATGLVQ